MKNYNLGRQECRNRAVFDGFHAVFGVLCSVVSLRQGLSDKLLGGTVTNTAVSCQVGGARSLTKLIFLPNKIREFALYQPLPAAGQHHSEPLQSTKLEPFQLCAE